MKLLVALALVCVFCAVGAQNGTLHLLPDAMKTYGAMCLDGTPTGYYLREGSGDGVNKWILHLEGGGWCSNTSDCYHRSFNPLGSSKHWPKSQYAPGFLSSDKTVNPDFYTWNAVYIMYCDGASFAGYVEKPDMYMNKPLYYRGRANLLASLNDLLSNGMSKATDVILTGCSAGGLATYLHADAVREMLPKTVKKYAAFPDAGYFLDTENINGVPAFREGVQNVYKMQNCSAGVNQDCLKAQKQGEEWRCMFAPYTYNYIKMPLFVLNSMYDTAQINGLFGLPCLPPNCSKEQLEEFYDYGQIFLYQARPVTQSIDPLNGFYIDSCQIHCQTLYDTPWSTFSINGVSMRDTVARWYNKERAEDDTRLMDCEVPYNCDQSCSAGVMSEGDSLTEIHV